MDPARFDRLAIALAAHPINRRRTLAAGAALLGGLVSAVRGTHAQGATPAASPAAGHEPADNNGTLFVQTATGGTMTANPAAGATPAPAGPGTPAPAAHGTYLLTLHGHTGETIGFSDRPERNFGELPTPKFFTGLGFLPNNPPNAALVVDTPEQQGAVVLVELLDPQYDPSSQTLTYEANVLHQYPNAKGDVLAPLVAKAQSTPPGSFTNVSLFIDDCPDSTDYCIFGCVNVGSVTSGNCWNWSTWTCDPCGSAMDTCNGTVAACHGGCEDDIALCGSPGCCGGGSGSGQCCENGGKMTCPC